MANLEEMEAKLLKILTLIGEASVELKENQASLGEKALGTAYSRVSEVRSAVTKEIALKRHR